MNELLLSRAVFRLTLVKSMNMTAVAEYAALIRRGAPDLIEIKGVTFCGNGKRNPLTMVRAFCRIVVVVVSLFVLAVSFADATARQANVPWHVEVAQWAQELCAAIGTFDNGISYGLACEHEHSCCMLLVSCGQRLIVCANELTCVMCLCARTQARKDRFLRDGVWHTWIDFDRFLVLAKSGEPFTSADCEQIE